MKKLRLNLLTSGQILSRDQLKQVKGGDIGSEGVTCRNEILGTYQCFGTMEECVVECGKFHYCEGCWQFT